MTVLDTLSQLPHVLEKYRHEEWFSSPKYYPVYSALAEVVKPTAIMEIGSLQGFSLISMMSGSPGLKKVIWVDSELYLPESNDMCLENVLYFCDRMGLQLENVRFGKRPEHMIPARSYLSCDDVILMHIDGGHTYDEKIVDLGISDIIRPDVLLVDDYSSKAEPDVRRATDDWVKKTSKEMIYIPTYRGMAVFVRDDNVVLKKQIRQIAERL